MMKDSCPFCEITAERIIYETSLALAIRDKYPLSPGHTLIVPKRHVGSFFDILDDEKAEISALIMSMKTLLTDTLQPDGFNIGINDGKAAGQTIPHLHIHLIPRFTGDHPDPRGGIRWVIPEKACYWE